MPREKYSKKRQKKEIQQEFVDKIGIRIDYIKQGKGTSTNGNSAICFPKKVYNMYQSFIIVPDNYCSSKGKLPRGYQTLLQLSKKLKAPILKRELLEKLADGRVSTFPSELKENLWQHPDVKDYVISPPLFKCVSIIFGGQIMQWSVVKKVGKTK